METQENKMGTMPVKKLIITMSLPMMISMLVQALYNVVDSVFLSHVSEAALTAVTLAYPMQNMMIAVGSGTGVGINALLSRSLGEKNNEQADKAANNAYFLAFCSFVLFLIVGLFVAKPFIYSQTDVEEIAVYGTTYTQIVCCFSLGVFFQMISERLLQGTGLTVYSMISQITGAVINVILDPILIYGLLGAPRLEVAGAAIATVIGQTVAAVVAIIFNVKFNKELHFSIKRILRPHLATIKRIYAVGVPSILMMAIGSIMTYGMNLILGTFSSTATAVFGAYYKLQSFCFMPVFGMNNGVVPILAYNYGARKRDRINEALRFALELAFGIMVVGMLIFEIFPEQLLSIFDASEQMMEMGVPALRTIAIHFPIAAIAIVLGTVFQAFSKSIYSLIVSLMRQIVVLLPVAYLLSLTGVLSNVWWCFLIAEVVSLITTVIFYRRVSKQVLTF